MSGVDRLSGDELFIKDEITTGQIRDFMKPNHLYGDVMSTISAVSATAVFVAVLVDITRSQSQ